MLKKIFGDTILEVLHFQEDRFKQLFILQFNTLFLNGNSLRFTKDQIDGVCKDLRYPEQFFIDLIFDSDKNIQSNNFEEDVIKWKNIISDFIVKGYKNNKMNVNFLAGEQAREKESNYFS